MKFRSIIFYSTIKIIQFFLSIKPSKNLNQYFNKSNFENENLHEKILLEIHSQ